jgi:hypothetical protein
MAAASGGGADPSFYVALGKSPREAAYLAHRARAARREAAALARHGFTP